MFWNCVTSGFKALAYWQVWAVVVAHCLVMLAVVFGGALVVSKRGMSVVGLAWLYLFAPACQVLATFYAIFVLAPILFGLGDTISAASPITLVLAEPAIAAKLLLGSLVFLVVLGAVGLLNVPGFELFAIGSLAAVSAAKLIAHTSPSINSGDLSYWPGFFPVLGFFAIGVALEYLVLGLVVVLTMLARKGQPPEKEAGIFVAPISRMFCFLPAFMYAAYLAPQLSGA